MTLSFSSTAPADLVHSFRSISTYQEEDVLEMARQKPLASAYQVISQIGMGGNSTVYFGKDLRSRSPVALKTYPSNDLPLVQELLLEEQLLRIQSAAAHALPSRGIYFHENIPWIAIDYLERATNELSLPLPYWRIVFEQLLEYAAGIHCPHADLKPENFAIEPSSFRVAVYDMGTAATALVYPILEIQTQWYRSPEAHLQKPPYTKAIDIWSLGVIAIELYIGNRPLFEDFSPLLSTLGPPPSSLLERAMFRNRYFVKDPNTGAWRFRYSLPDPIPWKQIMREKASERRESSTEIEAWILLIDSMLQWENRPSAEELLASSLFKKNIKFGIDSVSPSLRQGAFEIAPTDGPDLFSFPLSGSPSRLSCLHLPKSSTGKYYIRYRKKEEDWDSIRYLCHALLPGDRFQLKEEEGNVLLEIRSSSFKKIILRTFSPSPNLSRAAVLPVHPSDPSETAHNPSQSVDFASSAPPALIPERSRSTPPLPYPSHP